MYEYIHVLGYMLTTCEKDESCLYLLTTLTARRHVTAADEIRHDAVELAQLGALVFDWWTCLVQRDLHKHGGHAEPQQVLTLKASDVIAAHVAVSGFA